MNRELAIGLIFLILLALILALGLFVAWRVQRRGFNLYDTPEEAADRRKVRLFKDLDTHAIQRGVVYRATHEGSVSGVEPRLARAESWPLRQRR